MQHPPQYNDLIFDKNSTQNAKNKTTTIKLSFANAQQIDRFDFKIAAPRLYKRHASVYANRPQTVRGKAETHKEFIFSFDLNADKETLIEVPKLWAKEVLIEVENKDNLPLEIESLGCKQLVSYLVCDLKARQNYTLSYGNWALKVPEYDLVDFVSRIPKTLPEAHFNEISKINDGILPVKPKEISIFKTRNSDQKYQRDY